MASLRVQRLHARLPLPIKTLETLAVVRRTRDFSQHTGDLPCFLWHERHRLREGQCLPQRNGIATAARDLKMSEPGLDAIADRRDKLRTCEAGSMVQQLSINALDEREGEVD